MGSSLSKLLTESLRVWSLCSTAKSHRVRRKFIFFSSPAISYTWVHKHDNALILYNVMYTNSLSPPHTKQKKKWPWSNILQNQWLHAFTTEGSTLSASRFGPSRWAVGEPSLESVLLSDEFMLVSLTLVFTTLAVITCIVSTTVTAETSQGQNRW